jgi:hypothetical protein
MNNNAGPPPNYQWDQGQPQAEALNWAQWLDEANMAEPTIPTADYDAQVISARPTEASTGKLMFDVTFRLVSGTFAGKEFSRNITWSGGNAKKSAKRVFFRQMSALGLDEAFLRSNPTPQMMCDRMINNFCRIEIKQREFPIGSGLFDNEVGFIRDGGQQMINQGVPAMLNQQGFPGAPQMPATLAQAPQQFAPQQPVQQPAQTYAAPMGGQPQQGYAPQPQQGYPQGYPQQGGQPQQQYAQPSQMPPPGQQFMTSSPDQPQPQQPPPPPPGQPQFETMLRPPQEGTQPGAQLPQAPNPYPPQEQVVEATPADGQPLPTQIPPDQAAAFQAYMAQQQGGQQAGTQPQQPPAPPLPRQF